METDFAELEQRPAKKRRFFVEDSPVHDSSLNAEPSLPDEVDALPEAHQSHGEGEEQGHEENLTSNGFDVDLLSSFVGESLPGETVSKLRELSGGDIQRGNSHCVT
jgi:DNA repair protein RAD5